MQIESDIFCPENLMYSSLQRPINVNGMPKIGTAPLFVVDDPYSTVNDYSHQSCNT